MSDIAELPEVTPFGDASSLGLQTRRIAASIIGRSSELQVVNGAIARAHDRLAGLTAEGEPGIGKTRLLAVAGELAKANGFTPITASGDEEVTGPYLLARSIFANPGTRDGANGEALEAIERALVALSGGADEAAAGFRADAQLIRVLDQCANTIRLVSRARPLALLLDDLQWADEDSLRLLRYVVRTDVSVPIFVALGIRPEESAFVGELVALVADLERSGVIRRLRLGRFNQVETAELVRQILGGRVDLKSSATIHAQSEGVPFIVEQLTQTYRESGLVQNIDGTWVLAPNAERLVPSAVRTLIQRRAARLPAETKSTLAQAAVLGRAFSVQDVCAIRTRLGGTCEAGQLAETLVPAVAAGLLAEQGGGSAADFRFPHEQVREFAASLLTGPQRRAIHAAVVELLIANGEPPASSLPVLARHAVAAGDSNLGARYSAAAARGALQAHAPDEALRLVEQALPIVSAAPARVELLRVRDDALDMLRRPEERLEGLAELAALANAVGDEGLELDVALRRAAALRTTGEEDRAAQIAREVRDRAAAAGKREAELAACLELGQALLRSPLGEGYTPTPVEADLDGATEAYGRAADLAEQLGDERNLAAVSRELGVVTLARIRVWFIERIRAGEHKAILEMVASGVPLEEILPTLPIEPLVEQAGRQFERALEIFERLGDRRGSMATIIAMAYMSWAPGIHVGTDPARRIEELRRLASRMQSLTNEGGRALAEAQMLYGVHVFARSKVVPDLALARGREAYEHARMLGERGLEFLAAGGSALALIDLGRVDEAATWLDRAAAAASAAPTPHRARQLEIWRGLVAGARGEASAMRDHFARAIDQAAERRQPAARAESLALLALEAARLAVAPDWSADESLLALAEESATQAKMLAASLPGHAPWIAQANAALARVASARGDRERALEFARAALDERQAAFREDPHLEILLPAARAVLASDDEPRKEVVRRELSLLAALIAQRTLDESVRVAWFNGPLGRELRDLAGPLELPRVDPGRLDRPRQLDERDDQLLRLLAEGRTNDEIAQVLGVEAELLGRRLLEMYARIGADSRAEATALAFRQGIAG